MNIVFTPWDPQTFRLTPSQLKTNDVVELFCKGNPSNQFPQNSKFYRVCKFVTSCMLYPLDGNLFGGVLLDSTGYLSYTDSGYWVSDWSVGRIVGTILIKE